MKNTWIFVWSLALSLPAFATTPLQLQRQYESQSGAASAQRGQQFFTTTQGKTWSCSTCHGAVPTGMGEHAETQKRIKPLAPQVNPKRFSDEAKVDKWFKRNCDDVLGRECTPQQKADVIAWLLTLK
ncbi:MAG: DUF1924 domain-containing protein [Limnohabitans sp.]|jgi:uncharacterized membrane protein|nr:DUF1924 domain-containing protein [Limnohabitans sp.]